MSTIDLIILGFMLDRQMNAYELASLITEKQVDRFLKISTPAVYKSCKRLCSEGFLSSKTIKEGAQPEKTIYSINEQGREKFASLMRHFSSNLTPFFLDFNVFIFHLEKLEKEQGLEMLDNLKKQLLYYNKWIVEHEKEIPESAPFASKAIVKQYRMSLSTLLRWSEEAILDYKKHKEM